MLWFCSPVKSDNYSHGSMLSRTKKLKWRKIQKFLDRTFLFEMNMTTDILRYC